MRAKLVPVAGVVCALLVVASKARAGNCPDLDLGSAVGSNLVGAPYNTTVGQANSYAGSCGGGSAPDRMFRWTAPATATYTFDTVGSTFDTVIYVQDVTCGGSPLGCDDNGAGTQSRVSVSLLGGQTVMIVIDGAGTATGTFVLNIANSGCAHANLGSATGIAVVTSTTTDGSSIFEGSCNGGSSRKEKVYLWTAPATGAYSFDTMGDPSASIVSAVYLRNTSCTGAEIVCAGNASSQSDPYDWYAARATAPLTAGQTIAVVIDGRYSWSSDGSFQLNIQGPTGPMTDLGSALGSNVASGTTAGGTTSTHPTCYYSYNATPDKVFKWTAPAAGTYSFDSFGSAFNTVLTAYNDGSPGGAILGCSDNTGTSLQSQVSVTLAASQVVAIAIDGNYSASGTYQLNVVGPTTCSAATDLVSAVGPSVATGTTADGANNLAGTCGGGAAKEKVFKWTAPTTGTYKFDTIGAGTNFDTVLHVRSGSCSGAAVACNDNDTGSQSKVQMGVVSGQVFYIVVDGAGTASGNFQLNITAMGCEDADLGSATGMAVVAGTTLDGFSNNEGSCNAGSNRKERVYKWTAPATGAYSFDSMGDPSASIVSAVYLRNTSCTGAEIVCAGNGSSQSDPYDWYAARATASLTAGQVVYIFVDGRYSWSSDGSFQLNIQGPNCPMTDLGTATGAGVAVGTTTGGTTSMHPTCYYSYNATPDKIFRWTAPAAGTYTFDTFGSAFNTVLSVLDNGSCGGAVLGCNDDTAGVQSRVQVDLAFGQQVAIAIDGNYSASGAYQLNITSPIQKIYWVHATSGSDVNPGTLTAPWATLSKAFNIAQSGDIVYVVPGTYAAPSGAPLASGTPINPIKFIADTTCTQSSGVLGGCTSGAVNVGAGSTQSTMYLGPRNHIQIDGFTIAVPTSGWYAGIQLEGANNTIKNNVISGSAAVVKYGILVKSATATNNTVTGNTITLTNSTADIGIYLDSAGATNTISNNVVNNAYHGIRNYYTGTGQSFSNNRITGAAVTFGIWTTGSASGTYADTTVDMTGGSGTTYGLYIESASNSTITRTTVRGAGYGVRIYNSDAVSLSSTAVTDFRTYGIELLSTTTNTVTNCSVTGITGVSFDGINVGTTGSPTSAQVTTVTGCDVGTTNRDGIAVGQNYVTIRASRFHNNARYGVALLSGSYPIVDGVESYSNTYSGIYARNATDVTIQSSDSHNNGTYGIQLKDLDATQTTTAYTVKSSRVTANAYTGIVARRASNLLIDGNLIDGNNTANVNESVTYCLNYATGSYTVKTGGIHLAGDTRKWQTCASASASREGFVNTSTIRNNAIKNNTGHGIFLYGGQSNQFLSNLISGNTYTGVTIESEGRYSANIASNFRDASGNAIDGNTITGNSLGGIELKGASGNNIKNNVIATNGQHGIAKRNYPYGYSGIHAKLYAKGNVINNLIYKNTLAGVVLEPGCGGEIRENTFYQNSNAIGTQSYTASCSASCSQDWDTGVEPAAPMNPGVTRNETITIRNNAIASHTTGAATGIVNGFVAYTSGTFTQPAYTIPCTYNAFNGNTSNHDAAVTCTSSLPGDPDPQFVNPAGDDFHLKQIACTQLSNSPLVNAGSTTAAAEGMDAMSTCTAGVVDSATVDIGFHYLATAAPPATTLTVALASHTISDVSGCSPTTKNAFCATASAVTNAQLLGFKLTNNSTGPIWITGGITVKLANRIGLLATSWSGIQLAIDTNGDGTIGSGETTTVGGPGAVSIDNAVSRSTGSISFAVPFSIATGTTNFIVRASFGALNPLEQTDLSVASADIILGAGYSFLGAATITNPTTHKFRAPTAYSGTTGTYFKDTNFATMQAQRLDSTIDLAYTNPAPPSDAYGITGLPSAWSARWYGAFYAPCDGDFTIYADPEGKVKLVTDWNYDFDTGEVTAEQSVLMKEIKTGWHPFALSYVESGSGASEMKLSWSATCGGITKQVIPTARLATIPDPGGYTSPPSAVYACIPGSTTVGYELTDRSIAMSFTSNVLTTATMYYRISPSGSWSSVADTAPRLTRTIATPPALTAATAYDFYAVITDMNGNSTTLTSCTASTTAAESWCRGGPAIRQNLASGRNDTYLLAAPNFRPTPGFFFDFFSVTDSDNFVTRLGYDYSSGLGTKTAVHRATANACTYYVSTDDGVYWTTGSLPTVIANDTTAGTRSASLSTRGSLEMAIRQTETTGMAEFQVKELCAWRGDLTPQPISSDRWLVTCNLGDVTGPIIGGVTVDTVNATGMRGYAWLNETGFGKVDYGTAPGALTMCVGHCEGAAALAPVYEREFDNSVEFGINNLAPSTIYYYRLTAWDLRGNTTVDSVRTFTTPAEPAVVAGSLDAVYASDMVFDNIVVIGTASTVDFTEGVGGWPPAPTPSDSYAAVFLGYVLIPDACDQNDVTFIVTARDGSAIMFDDLGTSMGWTIESAAVEQRTTRRFSKGWHTFGVGMFNYQGTGSIRLEWEATTCGLTRALVPSSALGRSSGSDTTPPSIVKTCDTPPAGQSCTTPYELTVAASSTCASPSGMAAPTTRVTDDSMPVTECWRPVSANSCASNLGWPSSFPLGTTVLPYLAIDAVGNSADAGLTVRLLDQTPPAPPTVTLSPGVVVGAGSPKVVTNGAGCDLSFQATSGSVTVTAREYFDASTTDNCGVASYDAPGSTVVPVGVLTPVGWAAMDNAGNRSLDTSKILCALDVVAPSVTVPGAALASCTGATTRVTLSAPTVADDNDPAPMWRWEYPDGGAVSDCDAGAGVLGYTTGTTSLCGKFPFGGSIIRVRAFDTSGNLTLSANRDVVVNDTVSPS
ncbi:MAG: right-handed parallel beta-helix repeat-containing protein, partial [Deltaproteobacteria bacterium]|nr:right-handed parallel beta-helix repeat-containing protein [Deltaproteobacteria bacterium]